MTCVVINTRGAFLCDYANGIFTRKHHGEVINRMAKVIWLTK